MPASIPKPRRPSKTSGIASLPALPPSLSGLPASALAYRCDPASLGFATTDDLPDLESVIGQPRAIRALELGSEVSIPGYNIFILGVPDSGRTTLSQEYLERKAASEPVPEDWCYVNNFDDSRSPRALRLPPGQGTVLRKAVQEMVRQCHHEIPRRFESEEFTRERDQAINELKKAQETEFLRLQEHVQKFNFVITRSSAGLVLVPALEGKPITPEEIEALSPEAREKLTQVQARLSEDVERVLARMREMERGAAQRLRELTVRTAAFLLDPWITALKESFAGLEQVTTFLDALHGDMMENVGQFFPNREDDGEGEDGQRWVERYEVNVLVDNAALKGAPVIVESYPSYNNLLGRIEHEIVMGGSRTNFNMIRAGALHRANGGYLIIPARDVLVNPYAWDGLKRVLRHASIRIVELGNQLGVVSTVTLEPEPIPLQAKVVLIGTPMLYYLLREYDEDFAKLFKVRAEFARIMDRSPETEHEYALFVKSVVINNQLPPFDNTAVARIIEHSARLAEDQSKLYARFGQVADLICEAAYWARKENHSLVTQVDVQRAIDEGLYRNNLYEERLQELIDEGTFMIDTSGARPGQINALSVLSLGDYAFGRPTRLTASAFPGRGGVMDIERQAKLGGPIHTKGVLILSGFLGARFGRNSPLNLSASLTFEQSYEGVEGDSASAAELLTLLSAVAQVPLRQDRAITGSINQHGQIQAIGGINEKIEGFFAVCKARPGGLTGEQGVVFPHTNIKNLMLRAEVVQAVAEGKFHVWPIRTIEEAIQLFTGLEAGDLLPDDTYPPGSFNRLVTERFASFAEALAPKKNNNGSGSPAEPSERDE